MTIAQLAERKCLPQLRKIFSPPVRLWGEAAGRPWSCLSSPCSRPKLLQAALSEPFGWQQCQKRFWKENPPAPLPASTSNTCTAQLYRTLSSGVCPGIENGFLTEKKHIFNFLERQMVNDSQEETYAPHSVPPPLSFPHRQPSGSRPEPKKVELSQQKNRPEPKKDLCSEISISHHKLISI